MSISIFDLFSIGVGPSSSHTVGPMRAANLFIAELKNINQIINTARVVIDLYGSLALTGKGHCTDYAIIIGLESNLPENIEPTSSHVRYSEILKTKEMHFAALKNISFDPAKDLIFHYDKVLSHHSNGMCFSAFDADGKQIFSKVYYSVGGGFVVDEHSFNGNMSSVNTKNSDKANKQQPYPFNTAKTLLKHCKDNNKTIADIVFANELVYRSEQEIKQGILNIWHVMKNCINKSLNEPGILPGGLNIKRRAPELYQKLTIARSNNTYIDNDMNWLSLYAIAVNEENAAGGKVVTAPTNGAAGTIPSVLKYFSERPECTDDKIVEFLLTAAAIGILYKERASISAAEVGCQGEVGVACSMAAAAYAAVLGGDIYQVENAAEIGMEHNLGMTCDPIGGLVQIPCIERNAAGAVQAVNAAQLALLGDGKHYVSLDKVIDTMRETGRDMMSKYKETSLGGLAVNLPEC
jgi:L-serine dehydratase